MQKTKIDWCDYTWNPAIGCRRGCPYCYAERINKRFKYIEKWTELEWKEHSFNKKFPKISSRIFVNSMSDVEYWNKDWIHKVIYKIEKYPQHTFLFLTKNPLSYKNFLFPDNCLLGCTITNNDKLKKVHGYFNFLSIEPLLTEIDIRYIPSVQWIIIGAETGNRKGKIIPRKEWIDNIILYCKNCNIPVFLKESLRPIYHDNLIQQFPK